MNQPQLGNKSQVVSRTVKNADTVPIPAGTPVVLAVSGTDDGLAVVLPGTAGTARASSLCVGISGRAIPVGGIDSAVCSGVITNAKITMQTRATSTDSFASANSMNFGDVLVIETVGNGFSRSAAGAQSANVPAFALCQSVASQAGQASNSSNTGVASQVSAKVLIQL